MITEQEQERIREAISRWETLTAGEIVVVLARQASAYRSIPFLLALCVALLLPWPLIMSTSLGPSRLFLIQVATALILSLILSLPRLRIHLVPRFIKRARAHDAAVREFLARGVTHTRGRTGILIYVAIAERYAEILPDSGLGHRVDALKWRSILEDLVASLRAEQAATGLLQAVDRLGALLAEEAPGRFDDVDELPNKVIVM